MMKKYFPIILVFVVLSITSCKKCGECFTPPSPFLFEFIDKTTNENLFTNGTYQPNQIDVINTIDNEELEFAFIVENDVNILQINSIGWKT